MLFLTPQNFWKTYIYFLFNVIFSFAVTEIKKSLFDELTKIYLNTGSCKNHSVYPTSKR